MNIEQLEAKCESLRKAVESGDMSKLGDYAYALAERKAAELGVDMPDLEHVDTPPLPDHARQRLQAKVQRFFNPEQEAKDRAMGIDKSWLNPKNQIQVDSEYVQFLEARTERLKVAIREAAYWLDAGSPGRALETLRRAMV